MSSNDQILGQYATSATPSARRGLYDTNIGVSLTDRLTELLKLDTATSLLDVGCGYGSDIAAFAQQYPRLRCTGFDQSQAQINDAKAKTPSAVFFVDDANTFQLKETFDRILVRHVLHLLPEPTIAIHNIFKHLSSEGRIALAVHSRRSQPKFAAWRAWFRDQTGIHYSAPSDALTIEDHQDMFRLSGWKVEIIEANEKIHLTEAEPYLAYIKGQKRWSREPSSAELNALLEHAHQEIETDIATQGYFEDDSINGIIVLER